MADIRIVPASSIMSFTSSLNFIEKITQDASGSLNLYGSGSTGRTELLSVDGNNGRLFTVSDDLSDSLFSVNTIAGLPVIEAFANNTVNIGQYSAPPIKVTGSQAIITGSLFGTASYALNGGVTSIVAGTNVTISPAGGQGAVTINASGGGGGSAFPYTGSALITGSLGITGSLSTTGADALINGVTVGRGAGNIASNTIIGSGSLRSATNGAYNTAVGVETLASIIAGAHNTAVGYRALYTTTGNANTAIGSYAGYNNAGNNNIIIGYALDNKPDQTYFTGYHTLSIGKDSGDTQGLPHIWAPDSTVIADTDNDPILTLEPTAYSGFFIEYVLDNTSGVMRAGTIKGIFTSTMSSIEWTEDSTLSIGDTSSMVFTVVDNGSSKIEVRLENTSGATVYCNFTSRLILRQL